MTSSDEKMPRGTNGLTRPERGSDAGQTAGFRRVALGGYPPRAPTDPDVPVKASGSSVLRTPGFQAGFAAFRGVERPILGEGSGNRSVSRLNQAQSRCAFWDLWPSHFRQSFATSYAYRDND